LDELLKVCNEVNDFEKKSIKRNLVFFGFCALGIYFGPVMAVPAIVCASVCIYPGLKIRQINKYRKDFIKRIQKDKEGIEYWDSINLNEIKQVLLDNKGEIKNYLK
ncbi:MAG: hypothetical protein KKA65_00575, partial [Nanoarchaeota archaeon]|nr:hypothetical protein [Nanoarchaeota archaeon]MCG2720328.1 hypothetical protein [Nanoarchaeota archaeon]